MDDFACELFEWISHYNPLRKEYVNIFVCSATFLWRSWKFMYIYSTIQEEKNESNGFIFIVLLSCALIDYAVMRFFYVIRGGKKVWMNWMNKFRMVWVKGLGKNCISMCCAAWTAFFPLLFHLRILKKKEKMKISLFCSIALLSSSLRQTTRHFMQFNLSFLYSNNTRQKKLK